MTESSLYENWVNSLEQGFRNKGLTCQMKTDGTACQRSEWSFWHVVFFFSDNRLMEELCQLLKNN